MHPLTENTYTPLHGHTKKNHEFKYFFKSPFSELTIYILCFSPMQFEIVEILNLLYPKCFVFSRKEGAGPSLQLFCMKRG